MPCLGSGRSLEPRQHACISDLLHYLATCVQRAVMTPLAIDIGNTRCRTGLPIPELIVMGTNNRDYLHACGSGCSRAPFFVTRKLDYFTDSTQVPDGMEKRLECVVCDLPVSGGVRAPTHPYEVSSKALGAANDKGSPIAGHGAVQGNVCRR